MWGHMSTTDLPGSSLLAGRYRLVYFGYAFCPDVCPVDLQTISAGLRQFEQSDPAGAAKVQPVWREGRAQQVQDPEEHRAGNRRGSGGRDRCPQRGRHR